jgi:GntR family transcriptional regulator
MLNVKVDEGDPTDLYEQVAGEIRRAIADGEAKPGERLPPAKDLAAVLGVNTNTVLRSLRILRDEELLEFRRGRGISFAGTPERGVVVQRARELIEFARTRATAWTNSSRSSKTWAERRATIKRHSPHTRARRVAIARGSRTMLGVR